MIPANAANHRNMRMIMVELRNTVDGRSEVFVAFHHHVFGRFAEAHHHIKAFQLRPNHEIRLNADLFQYMENHRSDSRFAVAAADNDARFVLALLVKVFGIGIHLQAKFLSANQFWVVDACVHTENDGIVTIIKFLGKPAPAGRQDSFIGQARLARLKDFVIRTRDFITLAVQGNGEVVHGTPAYGNKMDFFHSIKQRRVSYSYRTATTSYPCYIPVLGDFRGSWSYKTYPLQKYGLFLDWQAKNENFYSCP